MIFTKQKAKTNCFFTDRILHPSVTQVTLDVHVSVHFQVWGFVYPFRTLMSTFVSSICFLHFSQGSQNVLRVG